MLSEQMLGQARENSANAVSVYSPSSGEVAIITNIMLCNTSAATATYRVFHSNGGTTYDESTALAWDVVLGVGEFHSISSFIAMSNPAGNIAYRSSVANAVTCTVYGAVKS